MSGFQRARVHGSIAKVSLCAMDLETHDVADTWQWIGAAVTSGRGHAPANQRRQASILCFLPLSNDVAWWRLFSGATYTPQRLLIRNCFNHFVQRSDKSIIMTYVT